MNSVFFFVSTAIYLYRVVGGEDFYSLFCLWYCYYLNEGVALFDASRIAWCILLAHHLGRSLVGTCL